MPSILLPDQKETVAINLLKKKSSVSKKKRVMHKKKKEETSIRIDMGKTGNRKTGM